MQKHNKMQTVMQVVTSSLWYKKDNILFLRKDGVSISFKLVKHVLKNDVSIDESQDFLSRISHSSISNSVTLFFTLFCFSSHTWNQSDGQTGLNSMSKKCS